MSAPVTVRRVETKAERRTFLRFPWALYRGDPHWVPPLVGMQRHKLDRRKSVVAAHGMRLFHRLAR